MSHPPHDDLEAFMAPASYVPAKGQPGRAGETTSAPVLPTAGPGGPGAKPPLRTGPPTGWNAPAFGMLAISLLALAALVWPQVRARATERKVRPMVTALAERPAGARCPRYITSVFTNVGRVALDADGDISDHTELTGPICDGIRRLWTPDGRREMRCLVTDGRCTETALRSVVTLSTIAHESMHLRGELDEARAECTSIAAGARSAELAGLTNEQGRMVAWLHLNALNPNTPPQYAVTPQNCPEIAELLGAPPGTPELRAILTPATSRLWVRLASGD